MQYATNYLGRLVFTCIDATTASIGTKWRQLSIRETTVAILSTTKILIVIWITARLARTSKFVDGSNSGIKSTERGEPRRRGGKIFKIG